MTQTRKNAKVALVKCCSYEQHEVDAALNKAFELLGGLEHLLSMDKNSALVLKPNLLSKSAPERACTTHPAVFKAAGSLLQNAGYNNLKYGDSPGAPMVKVEKVAEGCGIKAAAHELDIPIGDFEHGTQVDFKEGKVCDKFVLCDEVIASDGIINLCKMKTHQLERITGAVKNTFGCVYGVNKGASHAKFATAETFAKMIADLNKLVSPKLHIMDGIMAMEGNGPQSGTPVAMNVILVSDDPVAVDAVFCHLVNLKPELVPTNVSAMDIGVGTYENISVITEDGVITPQEAALIYGNKNFDVQRSSEFRGALKPIKFMAPLMEKKPVVDEGRCIGCGICVKSCPIDGKAIHLMERKGGASGKEGSADRKKLAYYDYSKCIKCYCCQEMCPEEAIIVKKTLLAKIADRKWRI